MLQGRSIETNAIGCQQRCRATKGCAFFTTWLLDRGCHLQTADAVATNEPKNFPTVTGSVNCPLDEAFNEIEKIHMD